MSKRSRHVRPMIPPPRTASAVPALQLRQFFEIALAAEELQRAGQLPAALRGYRVVMEAVGKRHALGVRCMFLTALCAWQMRIYHEAVLLMEEVRRCDWNNADVHYNLGLFYHGTGRPADAADCYRVALALKPGYAAAENNLGNALRELGDVETAQLCYDRLIERNPTDPEARYNLAHVMLLRGHLEKGFRLYDARWQCAAWIAEYGRRDIATPALTATTPVREGAHVFVYQEQGIGDCLQFLRYVPKLLALPIRVTLEVPLELGAWAKRALAGIDRLTVTQRGDPVPAHDFNVSLLSVPTLFPIHDEADIPPVWPLAVSKPSGLYTRPGDDREVIGFAWAGNPRHHNDRHRSAPLRDLARLFTRPNTRFVSLQVGRRGVDLFAELPTLAIGPGSEIVECSHAMTDLEATAAIIRQCAAVVTVDTSIAHVAGTLGVRTLILTSWLSEWRWQLERTDSPWYPSVELVRQPTLGDWPATIDRALALLGDAPASPSPLTQAAA